MALVQPALARRQKKIEESGARSGQTLGALGGAALAGGLIAATGGAALPAVIGAAGTGATLGGLAGGFVGEKVKPGGEVEGGRSFQELIGQRAGAIGQAEARNPQVYQDAIVASAQQPVEVRREVVPQLMEGFRLSLREQKRGGVA